MRIVGVARSRNGGRPEMPRKAEMTWVPSRRLWRKVYDGRVYTVSCKQLVEQGHNLLSETKEGSI